MLESVDLHDVATYRDAQRLESLDRVNLIFGTNGSGKTTLSRVLADPGQYPSCQVVWKRNQPLRTLVYNADFIARNFDQTHDLDGIFSLGEDSVSATRMLEEAKAELDRIQTQAARYAEVLHGTDGDGGKVAELNKISDDLRDLCWTTKGNFEPTFAEAFRGERNSRNNFRDRVLRERDANRSELRPLDELTSRAATLFKENAQSIALLNVPDFTMLSKLETDSLLAKAIFGRADVEIAGLIARLNNSDWVEQGRKFYDTSAPLCPFCQQPSPESLREQLEAFFDESFANDTAEISRLAGDYERAVTKAVADVESLIGRCPEILEETALRDRLNAMELLLARNRRMFADKKREPSRSVHCEESTTITAEVTALIHDANRRIQSHNALLEDMEQQRLELTGQVWRYLLENDLAPYLRQYDERRRQCLKAIDGVSVRLEEARRRRADAVDRVRELERQMTSVEPTVNRINQLLQSFGFSGFALEAASDQVKYRLVRPDGTDANATLSEGEKGFITFLYFMSLVRGSGLSSGIVEDKVVVIDDPVSSLDSSVMFVVASLIKDLFSEARRDGPVKQVIVLTHNVYFHKELTVSSHDDYQFWLIRKISGDSKVVAFETNPVRTSYELLWQQVRTPDPVSIQNVLRRILEHYFQVLGGVRRISDLEDRFSDPVERTVCRSLVSWVHDGSHSVLDDPSIGADESTLHRYLIVFKRIFELTENSAHYHMMMGNDLTAS